MKKIFITGADTDIGKTFVSLGLVMALKKQGKRVGYFKPFQSGAYQEGKDVLAPDVVEMRKYNEVECSYSYLLEGEVSPYLAAKKAGVEIQIQKVVSDIENFSKDKDITIIEGAGGLYCPIKKGMLFDSFIKLLDVPAIIVTTPDLGRLNHTLMSVKCALDKNIKLEGLIINKMPNRPDEAQKNFVLELSDFLNEDIKILAEIPELQKNNKEEILKAFQGAAEAIIDKNLQRSF